MPKTDQRASVRPIAFALHDTVHGLPPEIFTLSIRPEDLVRSEPSNVAVTQTLGGAWADVNGPGVATCTIAGTTGWGAGKLPDGFEHFKELHGVVFTRYHELRAQAAGSGDDPDGIKLIFSDGLDEFSWVIVPNVFTLRRNRARPLLSQYQISMTKLSGDVSAVVAPTVIDKTAAQISLALAVKKINAFAANIKGDVAAALGPLKSGVTGLMNLTGTALESVRALSNAGGNVVNSAFAPVLEIAHSLTQVSTNVMGIVAASQTLPLTVKRDIIEVKSALNNARCLLSNAIKSPATLPDYSQLYGSSNCSSTSGGGPASAYADINVFPELFPASASPVSMSAQAQGAVTALAAVDILSPPPSTEIAGLLNSITSGTAISSDAVAKAIAGTGAAPITIMGAVSA